VIESGPVAIARKLNTIDIVNTENYKNFTRNFIKHEEEYNTNRAMGLISFLGMASCGVILGILSASLPLLSTGFLALTLSGVAFILTGCLMFGFYTSKNIKVIKQCGLNFSEFLKTKKSKEFKKLKEEVKHEINISFEYLQKKILH